MICNDKLAPIRFATLWHYNTADKLRDVRRDGYFDAARDMLRDGDRLYVNVQRGDHVTAAQDFCVAGRGMRIMLVPTSTALYPGLAFARGAAAWPMPIRDRPGGRTVDAGT